MTGTPEAFASSAMVGPPRQGTLAVAATSGLTGGGAALAAAPAPQDDVEPELTEEEDARVPAA